MHCPVCKAENTAGPHCRRCQADLSPLWRLEAHHKATLAIARERLLSGDRDGSVAAAAAAVRLHRDKRSLRELALARLMARDFVGAWHCHAEMLASEMIPRNVRRDS